MRVLFFSDGHHSGFLYVDSRVFLFCEGRDKKKTALMSEQRFPEKDPSKEEEDRKGMITT